MGFPFKWQSCGNIFNNPQYLHKKILLNGRYMKNQNSQRSFRQNKARIGLMYLLIVFKDSTKKM